MLFWDFLLLKRGIREGLKERSPKLGKVLDFPKFRNQSWPFIILNHSFFRILRADLKGRGFHKERGFFRN